MSCGASGCGGRWTLTRRMRHLPYRFQARVESLCTTIGRISERTQQQRNMVVLVRLEHLERDFCFREERSLDALIAMIRASVERQPVCARQHLPIDQRADASL